MTIEVQCKQCHKVTEHRHLHNEAHGVSGTHMYGSERFECVSCGCATHVSDDNANQFTFVIDKA
jgi:hypothetical protein